MATATKTTKARATTPAPPVKDVTSEPDASEPEALDVKALEKTLLDGIRAAVGKLDIVEKQAYVRLMHDGRLVGYVRKSKKGLLVQLEARVDDPADVEKAVDVIQQAYALSHS